MLCWPCTYNKEIGEINRAGVQLKHMLKKATRGSMACDAVSLEEKAPMLGER